MSQGLPDLFSPSTDRWFSRAIGSRPPCKAKLGR
jgi:hypothetical protein